MSMFMKFKTWMQKKVLRKQIAQTLKVGEHEAEVWVWPPPAGGGSTPFPPKASRDGEDRVLSETVGKAIFGEVDPNKKTKGIKVVVFYEDGTDEVLLQKEGPLRVFHHLTQDKPRFPKPHPDIPAEAGICTDQDVFTIYSTHQAPQEQGA